MENEINCLPKHIAIIMDGNGRWAKAQGLARTAGHKKGTETAKEIVRASREMGIEHLTLYTFSTENWKRPKTEVAFLFSLLKDFMANELGTLMEQNIRLNIFGELEALPIGVRQVMRHAVKKTASNQGMDLNLALNYSGRDEIVRACRAMIKAGVAIDDVSEEKFADFLYSAGQPDPELIIRTSGEERLSNFLLFQSAYSEFYFTRTLWPDFEAQELKQAVLAFGQRGRRFGKTGDQIDSEG